MNFQSIAIKLTHKFPGRPALAALKPTVLPNNLFEASGSSVPVLYHAGKSLVENIADSMFDGWYGYGFYAAFNAEFVRRWYGPIVTKIKVKSDSRVLIASIVSSEAPSGLLPAIVKNEFETNPGCKGNKVKTAEMIKIIIENPIHWVHAVDRLAMEKDYSVVIYNDEQVVIKPSRWDNDKPVMESVTVEGEEMG